MTSARHTAVVEKYRSPVEMVLVYRNATVYVAATSVITLRQYSLKNKLTFSEEKTQVKGLLQSLKQLLFKHGRVLAEGEFNKKCINNANR